MVNKVVDLSLRGLEFLWTFLILCLVGNMIALSDGGNPSIVNYAIFVAVFSMLSLFYLFPAAFNESFTGHPLLPIIIDGLNTLFFFCGAVALAAKLGAHSCSNDDYTSDNVITRGADNTAKRCREAQASDAFLFFGFFCYLVSFVFSAIGGRGTGVNLRGIRKVGLGQA